MAQFNGFSPKVIDNIFKKNRDEKMSGKII